MTNSLAIRELEDRLAAARETVNLLDAAWRKAKDRLEAVRSERLVNERVIRSLGLAPGPMTNEQHAERVARETEAAAKEVDARIAVEASLALLSDAQSALALAKAAPKKATAAMAQRCMSAREIAAVEKRLIKDVTPKRPRSGEEGHGRVRAKSAKAERKRHRQEVGYKAMAERARQRKDHGAAQPQSEISPAGERPWPHYTERERLERTERYGRWLP